MGKKTDHVLRQWRQREILARAGVLKGIPSLSCIKNTDKEGVAETNSSLGDSLRAYWLLSAADNNEKVHEFVKVIRNLAPSDLNTLGDYLEMELLHYHGISNPSRGPVLKAKGSGRSGAEYAMKVGTKAFLGVFVKVAADKAMSTSTCSSFPWVEPCGKMAGVIGLLMLMAGVILQERPGLSKPMLKLGVVGVAFSVLLPMAVSLSPAMASVFGVLATSIVVVTAALA